MCPLTPPAPLLRAAPLPLQTERFGQHFLVPASVAQAGADLCALFAPAGFLDGPDALVVQEPGSGDGVDVAGDGGGGDAALAGSGTA